MPVMLAVLLLAAVPAAGATTAAGVARATPPVLRLLANDVPTFRGTGFKPHERVRLAIQDGRSRVVVAVASAAGTFTKAVPTANPNNCTGFSVIATGNHGSHATLKRPPGVCPPPTG
jgi:hypothetical protein